MAWRQGADGQLGTADDRIFDSLATVDEIGWVGPVAMQQLAGYATSRGYVFQGHRNVGSFEGVRFTFDEADATLELVNGASARVLDHHLALDQRAVHSIVEARPVRSLDQLARCPYVGPSTLAQLKAHANSRILASR